MSLDAIRSAGDLSALTHTMSDPGTHTQPAPPTTPQAPPFDIDGDYVNEQWHLGFLGDIDAIWEEYTGTGVNVGVYDDGLMSSHEDLHDNYNYDLEVTVDGELIHADDPATIFGYPHGTAVAGLIAAGNNGFGTKGVAYGASLTGVTVFSGVANINGAHEGFIKAVEQADNFDVINNSWGKTPWFWQYESTLEQDRQLIEAWEGVVESGRNGLGTIIVKAAGNDNMNASGDAATSYRGAIVVGAYDDDGDASYYSSFGSSLLVSAPSNGNAHNRGLVTTDVNQGQGYNISDDYYGWLLEDDYTDQFGGTSGATPIVTAVVALMLEANPDLGWRDVQNILAYSAREIGSGVGGARLETEEYDWRENGAGNWNGGGLHYSEDYGYGAIDAYNAVRMAEVWKLFGASQANANETSYSATATNVTLLDMTTTEISFTFGGSQFAVDTVSIELDISHSGVSIEQFFEITFISGLEPVRLQSFLSDLDITLISPNGTETLLADFTRDLVAVESVDGVYDLVFNANAFRGEDGIGTWTLRINDPYYGNDGTVNSAKVTLHGKDGDQVDLNDDVYHYTSEVFKTLDRDGGRVVLNDVDGSSDWVDLATIGGDVTVRLGAGESSTGMSANGLRNIFTIAASAVIENAVTGDGNDTIFGNGAANVLHGMRGNDVLIGGAGTDTLSGGAGNDRLTGGADDDNFLFDRALNVATNLDVIVDFSAGDSIWLDATIFHGLPLDVLNASAFRIIGPGSIVDVDDRILYNADLGMLYFDEDGAGGLAAIAFARFETIPTDLSFDDFVVVSGAAEAVTPTVDREVAGPTVVEYIPVADPIGDGSPINGTDASEQIRTRELEDTIDGGGGDDYIYSGAGNDTINGGAGIDIISGGEGDDVIYGGGSHSRWGDAIFGDGGNDILHGSDDQKNHKLYIGDRGDIINGGDGDDWIKGYSGDDRLDGGEGNDTIYGDDGDDSIGGGGGDDIMYAGTGKNVVVGNGGVDTLVFEGNAGDYRFFFVGTDFYSNIATGGLWVERIDGTVQELTNVSWQDVEYLQFADETMEIGPDIGASLLLQAFGNIITPDRDPVLLVGDGHHMGAYVQGASTVQIVDMGAEKGGVDRIQAVSLQNIYGDIDLRSDAIGYVSMQALGHADWGGPSGFLVVEPYDSKLEIFAAAGERNLDLYFGTMDLDKNGRVIDKTATSVSFSSNLSFGVNLNGADVNGYNLAFESAETIRFKDIGDATIKWYVPNVDRIEIYFEQFEEPATLTRLGNAGLITIETALDDKLLATKGGSASYVFDADIEVVDITDPTIMLSSRGDEHIRFGNLGKVNASNDGTTGDDAKMNAGLGLRGRIELGAGNDEARILGSDAFKGGTIDGGKGQDTQPLESDVVRMTFGVAAAIGNISSRISNFEVLQLDAPTQAGKTKTNTVDVRNFDSLKRIDITGGEASNGDSRVTNIGTGSTVTFRNVGQHRLIQNHQNEIFSTYETFGNKFSNARLDVAGSGRSDILNLSFVGLLAHGLQTGTINTVGAETVKISTDALDQDVQVWNSDYFTYEPLSAEPTDPFAQALNLAGTKTVVLTGDTGWDFTAKGSSIKDVTVLDASGVWSSGQVGAVKATATAKNVTFTGGGGDDVLNGASGDDKLFGGDGNDRLGGGSGNDKLDGGLGADAMSGGKGNDIYYVDDVGDRVTESYNEGTDTVYSSVSFNLSSHVERIYLTGSADINAKGNSLDNTIRGNTGANVLTGGAGDDTFVFRPALGNGKVDTITDFNVKDDTIQLDNAFFIGLGKDGALASGAFFMGAAAHDTTDRVIYDKTTGALYFDADGSGSGAQVQFAELDLNLELTSKDFFII